MEKIMEKADNERNATPLIYTNFDYKKRCDLIGELHTLFNRLGIDNEMNIPDFILAEMVVNFLMTVYNTNNAVKKFEGKK